MPLTHPWQSRAVGGPRILLAGAWSWPWYEGACAGGLERLGCEVHRFSWFDRFWHLPHGSRVPQYHSLWKRTQYRLMWGPDVAGLNRALVRRAREVRPDIVWLYHGLPVFARTLRRLRRALPGCRLIQYTNDNPFGPGIDAEVWRHFRRAIPEFDLHFVFRTANLEEFRHAGARQVRLLRAYFVEVDDFPELLGSADAAFACDLVFAGHFEADGRLESLNALAAAGVKVNLFGAGWGAKASKVDLDPALRPQFPVRPALGAAYRKAICGAKIALSFLSKKNADTYTRRSFQIPAMRTFMLSEYTEELAALFREGVDAEFFRSPSELIDKVNFYLKHDALRARIAHAGYERVRRDGHEVTDRMRQWLADVQTNRPA